MFLPFSLDQPGVVLVMFLSEIVQIILHVTNFVRDSGESVRQPTMEEMRGHLWRVPLTSQAVRDPCQWPEPGEESPAGSGHTGGGRGISPPRGPDQRRGGGRPAPPPSESSWGVRTGGRGQGFIRSSVHEWDDRRRQWLIILTITKQWNTLIVYWTIQFSMIITELCFLLAKPRI